MTHELESYGLILLFVFVMLEGCGIPLPGETALITAAVLAGSGRFNIVEVIVVASAGAIIGDTIGYWIARIGGRRAIDRIPYAQKAAARFLPRGEAFFEKHGPKTVLIARFVAGLRIAIAWLAGLSRMPWLRFFAYNAAGGILWATTYGLAAYWFGQAAVDAVAKYGFFAVLAVVGVAVLVYLGHRILTRRMEARTETIVKKTDEEKQPLDLVENDEEEAARIGDE
ncbi:MAG TPA: DedA family protein [Gaiellaceae bacterium]|jgi:membrane protein DedA with SNARE-associated domain|nr:DedA family protein [Gaiellaceae bacterium]